MPEIITHPLTEQELGQMGPPESLVSQEGFFVRHPEKETVLAGLDAARVTAHEQHWARWNMIDGLQKMINGEADLSTNVGLVNPLRSITQAVAALARARSTYVQLALNHRVLKTAHEEWLANEEVNNPDVIIHFNRRSYASFMIGAIQAGIERRQAELAERREKAPNDPRWRPLPEVTWIETDHIRINYPHERIVPITLMGVEDPPDRGVRPVRAARQDSGGVYTDHRPYVPPPVDERPVGERHLPHLHGVRKPDSWKPKKPWWQIWD